MDMDWATISAALTSAGLQIAAGFALYMIGRWLIGFAIGVLGRVLTARNFDPTLQRYIASILSVLLNIVLVVAILGYFGIETTSFAALLAGVGLAVGAAWSGLEQGWERGCWVVSFVMAQKVCRGGQGGRRPWRQGEALP